MGLDGSTGWFGLNTTTPQMRFHVRNGGILSTGVTGTNPNIGAGTRLMWISDRAAFRAGVASGTEWDGANIGVGSVAFGGDNSASGDYAVATGFQNTVGGESSQAFGADNDVNGDCSSAMGGSNTVMQNASTAIGKANIIEASDALIFGIKNSVGPGSIGAISVGRLTRSEAANNLTIGSGASLSAPLLNDISQSIVLGMNSDVPTVFIEPSNGAGTFGNVGIGNVTSPTEVLDVKGTARFRLMPYDTADVFITGVRADTATGDYVLNYIPADSLGFECDWNIVNGGNDLATGYEDACVEGSVLIGTDQPQISKVFMINTDENITLFAESNGSHSTQIGAFITASGGTTSSAGLMTLANDSENNTGVVGSAIGNLNASNQGVRGNARGSNWNRGVVGAAWGSQNVSFGVYGEAMNGGSTNSRQHVGVYGTAYNYSAYDNFGGYFTACDSDNNIGVYADVCGQTGGVAGYFAGSVLTTQTPIHLSDETIKTDMSEMENPLEIINQLQPKQYYFNTSEYPHLNLKSELSYGFSAQQVQQVLPEVVREVHHPAKFDSLGEMISPPEELLGIQYQEFIAILTAGVKEQQAQITQQAQTIDDLQQSLNNQNDLIAQMMDQMEALGSQISDCCEGGFRYNPTDEGHGNLHEEAVPNGNILKQNVPNPFHSQTTISYKLEQGGKVVLNIYDRNGKPLATLVEAEQQAGAYRYQWDASDLPAGVYNYALYVDGELLVKKAIKLAD